MKSEKQAMIVPGRENNREAEARWNARQGYLYMLMHPDVPEYFKLGCATEHPQVRLKEHNTHGKNFLGQIVQRTGKRWQLIYYVPVTDAQRAESYFHEVFPRFGGLESRGGSSIEDVIKDGLKQNHYLDEARHAEMRQDELRDYDTDRLLNSMRAEWARDGVAEAYEEMLDELMEERRRNDQR
jgi:hypothetical protein